ncbi:MAG: methylenetetrahydrofolate reductase [NAD(P)H] [Oxalicibacterium faecigallinarum]|uniref:methylenetetrahydrofolate reductase [NAD(P)H] n=1 Tax=Oxalicibacterium faecigallinarum TaxID=573741 RepID=UPI0028071D15|nr:methylenetetrahydrofolate reductase [NAD(P)H] [Oxalicibacterium faecigallinarum]MDQ7970702.1 methylenetetrahydrofolate reductase [NAD(P)H] [Oxalicibacterium faecigallinarum]
MQVPAASLPKISFEFFPPKTPAGVGKLHATSATLAAWQPEFFSVTFGAGGSTQAGTRDTVFALQAAGYEAAPHLSCIGSSAEQLRTILDAYKTQGIRRLVALRGDLPSGYGGKSAGQFRYANELVSFIRAETGDWFHIEVAAYPEMHPQAPSPDDDVANFVRKANAGANAAITQVFYNTDAYFRFVDEVRKAGSDIPIVPGILPITNYAQLIRFTETCGAEVPRWMQRKLASFHDDTASLCAFGTDVVTEICDRLIAGGAPGLHFYTMNQSAPTLAILNALRPDITHGSLVAVAA